MTKEEYYKEIRIIKEEYEKKVRELDERFILSNSPCGIGDIIEDHIGRILVERIDVCKWMETPECLYVGMELRKSDNKPKINAKKRPLYQGNLKKIISRKED